MKWEQVGYGDFLAWRCKVPCGWFVRVRHEADTDGTAFFYPDPKHEWDGMSLP